MFFYFLAFVLALVTIFGFLHLQFASEHLHLQHLCVWSSSTVRRQLQEYNLFGFRDSNDGTNGTMDIVEISVTQAETPESQNTNTSEEPIEELQSIKLSDEGTRVQADEEASAIPISNTPEVQAQADSSESRDSVLSAINASLKRLSSAANSGRLNGAQLYQILLRETLLHEKTAKAENTEFSIAPSNSTVTIDAVAEDENNNHAEPKIKMYFGDTPMEYVPHQK